MPLKETINTLQVHSHFENLKRVKILQYPGQDAECSFDTSGFSFSSTHFRTVNYPSSYHMILSTTTGEFDRLAFLCKLLIKLSSYNVREHVTLEV